MHDKVKYSEYIKMSGFFIDAICFTKSVIYEFESVRQMRIGLTLKKVTRCSYICLDRDKPSDCST